MPDHAAAGSGLQEKKILDLQVLRAVAILFVVTAHWGILERLSIPSGWYALWVGVDLFFCVSGYVIASNVIRELRHNRWPEMVKGFYIKRIFRLWPSSIVWVIGTYLFYNAKYNIRDVQEAIAATCNYINLLFSIQASRGPLEASHFGLYWSLSLEEQFYMVAPGIIIVCRNVRHAIMFCGFIGLYMIAFVLHGKNVWDVKHVFSPAMFFRWDALTLGVFLAWLRSNSYLELVNNFTLRHRLASQALWLALCVVLATITSESARGMGVQGVRWVSAICVCLVLLGSCNSNLFGKMGIVSWGIEWIGDRSYTIYLTHILVFYWAFRLRSYFFPGQGVFEYMAAVIVLILVQIGVAELNYRLLEQPMRRWGRRIAAAICSELREKKVLGGGNTKSC